MRPQVTLLKDIFLYLSTEFEINLFAETSLRASERGVAIQNIIPILVNRLYYTGLFFILDKEHKGFYFG